MAKKLNICLISREFVPDTAWGGIATFSLDLARMLQIEGHDVTVISQTLGHSFETHYGGVKVIKCRTEYPFLPAWYRSLALFALRFSYIVFRRFLQIHKEKPFDLIDVPDHLAEGFFFSLYRKVPVVTRLHTPFSVIVDLGLNDYKKGLNYRIIKKIERFALNHSDVLYSPSKNLVNQCNNHLGLNINAMIFGYPVDAQQFSFHVRKNIEKIKILFAGRMESRKGIETIAEAFPIVYEAVKNISLTLLGADTPNIKGWHSGKDFLRSRFKECGCLDVVEFIDPVSLDELAGYFHDHDIIWVPSLYDNFPLITLEAMATGKVVVSSDAGGIAEALGGSGCIYIFPAGKADMLSSITIELAGKSDYFNKIGEEARNRVVNEYSYERIYCKTMELYEKAMKHYSEQ